MMAVVPSWSCSSTEIVTSACASLVRLMSSIVPTGCPATSTWPPLTSCPPFWNSRWYLCPARPSEEDHEHEDEADQQSPAAGNSGDPRAAPGVRRLPFRRHRSGAACPLLCSSTGSGSVLRQSSSPPPAPDLSVRARDSPGGILFLAPLRGGGRIKEDYCWAGNPKPPPKFLTRGDSCRSARCRGRSPASRSGPPPRRRRRGAWPRTERDGAAHRPRTPGRCRRPRIRRARSRRRSLPSPRRGSVARAGPEGPLATSSCSLRSAPGRRPPGGSAPGRPAPASEAGRRRGDSNATTVSAERRTRSSSPARRGRNPSKRHRWTGRPDATSAVVTADGPGRTSTSRSRFRQARISGYPGSEIAGVPASEISTTLAPRSTCWASWTARSASFPSWLDTNRGRSMSSRSQRRPARRVSSQATRSASPRARRARGLRSSMLPIGVGQTVRRPAIRPP